MTDRPWVVYEQPRWVTGFMRSDGEFSVDDYKDLGAYLCSIGNLDVFRTKALTVRVARDPEIERGHNYTMVRRAYELDNDAPLYLADGDVVPTPYEMCLLFQMAPLLWDRDWRPDLTERSRV